MADDAIGHAAAADEMLWAARLIERHFDTVYYWRSEGATIRRWVSALPPDLARSRPRLLLVQALMTATGGNLGAVEPFLAAAERAAAEAAEEPFEPTAGRAGSMLVNVPALIALHRSYLAQLRGDAESTAAFAQRVLAELGGGERLVESLAQWNLAVAEWLRGRPTQAARAFASSIAAWRTVGQRTLAAYGGYQLGQVQQAQGRLDAAARTCLQAMEFAALPGQPAPPTAGPAYVGLAEVAYQRNELDTALRQVTDGIALCRRFVYSAPLAAGLVTLAWIREAMGDPAGAREAMGEAGEASPGPAGPLNPVPAQQARLLLTQGDVAGVARWAQQNGLGPDDEPDYAREPGHLVLARILLAQDRPGQALALLDRLHAAAAAQGRTGSLIETGALRALALAATGDEAGGGGHRPGRNAHAGLPAGLCAGLRRRGPADGRAAGCARRGPARRPGGGQHPARLSGSAAGAFAAGPHVPGPARDTAAVPGLIDPLTSRELEVLNMLAAGRSNQAIAGELVVTLDTVKKHVGHVLGKLGAANRTEAVARARELNLL